MIPHEITLVRKANKESKAKEFKPTRIGRLIRRRIPRNEWTSNRPEVRGRRILVTMRGGESMESKGRLKEQTLS